jgi:membrane fusion protein
VVRAPANGVITALAVQPGQAVGAGHLLMKFVPEGSEMQVEALVPSSAIGFVMPSQKVSLQFRAFPFQKFGVKAGKVRSISSSTLSPDELAVQYGIKGLEESMYRVRIDGVPQHIVFNATQRPLMPGMLVDADIMVEQRRIYEWVLGPVYALKNKTETSVE